MQKRKSRKNANIKNRVPFNRLLGIVFLITLVMVNIYLIDNIIRNRTGIDTKSRLTSIPENSGCEGMDLINSAYCLQEELGEFYKYNITNVDETLTYEQLKEWGGVCSHYAEFYSNRMKELGYDAVEVVFSTGENSRHEVAIASSNDSYCILDQEAVKCIRID